jgi:hypothetical protein
MRFSADIPTANTAPEVLLNPGASNISCYAAEPLSLCLLWREVWEM